VKHLSKSGETEGKGTCCINQCQTIPSVPVSGFNSVTSLSPRAEEAGVSAGGRLDGYYPLSERRQWCVTQW